MLRQHKFLTDSGIRLYYTARTRSRCCMAVDFCRPVAYNLSLLSRTIAVFMQTDELKRGVIVRGPLFTEPDQLLVVTPTGDSFRGYPLREGARRRVYTSPSRVVEGQRVGTRLRRRCPATPPWHRGLAPQSGLRVRPVFLALDCARRSISAPACCGLQLVHEARPHPFPVGQFCVKAHKWSGAFLGLCLSWPRFDSSFRAPSLRTPAPHHAVR